MARRKMKRGAKQAATSIDTPFTSAIAHKRGKKMRGKKRR